MKSARNSPNKWRVSAASVGVSLPLASWHPATLAWAGKRRKSERWCVAFSGGADSLALVLSLWAHWPSRRAQLVALHFNHRLRGRESDADEKFCRAVCAGLGVRLRVGRWNHAGRALDPMIGGKVHPAISEAEARGARHDFFAKELARAESRVLWLAHQQDDIAETLLMRLARGSGSGGLAAPRPVQLMKDGRVHLRPLLSFKKEEVVAALEATGVVWREDSSNAGAAHFRNRVRHAVIPIWAETSGRDARAGAALTRDRLEEDDDALEQWVTSLAVLKRGRLDVRSLAGRPRAVTRRALHRWLLALATPVDLSRQGFELLLAAVEAGRATRFSLGKQGFAVIADGGLRFRKSL